MSNSTINRTLVDATAALDENLAYEQLKDPLLKSEDRLAAIEQLATTYVKYIRIFKKFELAYDQMVHPQKRLVLRGTVDAVLGRLLEMKHELVALEASDMHNYSNILLDLKLSPEDIELRVPTYARSDRAQKVQDRNILLDKFAVKKVEQSDPPPVNAMMRLEDAIRVLQVNERGRQGNLRAKYLRDIKLQADREKRDFDEKGDEGEVSRAATTIQKIWKGYKTRKRWLSIVEQENIFLGMSISRKDAKQRPAAKAEANAARRKDVQQQFEDEYHQALITIKEKIRTIEGPDIKEGYQDSFRQWYMDYKRENGKLPDFPTEKQWQHPNFKFGAPDPDAIIDPNATTAADRPPSGKKGAAAKGKAGKADPKKKVAKGKDGKGKDAKGKDAKGKGKGKKGEPEPPADPSALQDLTNYQKEAIATNKTYSGLWVNKDESENFAQRHDAEIIKNDKRKEVETEIKLEVFELLKEELKNLKIAVEKDKGKKKGKKGKKDKKGKKGGKGKKEKGKKGRKEKDLTAGRAPEELFEELSKAGIIQKYNPVHLSDFLGDFGVMEKQERETTLVEQRRLMMEYAIFPLGFTNATTNIPCVGSMLLYGAHGTGKTMLAKAVATETDATFFNISPKNTAGQYVGKASVTKMLHMVFKVARLYAPSVIYIDNAEMIYAKKIPKDDTSDPKRIKKDLAKYCKGIKAVDHIMVIGCSSKPWDADMKTMTAAFPRVVHIAKPDYGSRQLLWKEGTQRAGPLIKRHVNHSVLARMSEGITTGGIFTACKMVLTERRLKMVRYRSLTTSEFLNCMLLNVAINPEENKVFKDWSSKLPLSKRWNLLTYPETEPEEKKPDKKGKKGDAPKKKK